jgi:hypothetical protein
MVQFEDRAGWARELKAFTDRNAGRRTVLEIDGPDLGAQREEQDYPLRGVAYDPRDGRVEIMLGEQGSVDRHLTHTIDNAEAIDVLRGKDGRDVALRIQSDGTQALLKLLS